MQAKTTQTIESQEKLSRVVLTANFHLTLHTRIAEALLNGDWDYGRMGLIQFARLTALLWKAYKEDDPYAEWTLLKTYEAIEMAKEKLKHDEILLQQQMANLRGFDIELFKNETPVKQPLLFSTPFAFMAAMLIERVDYINRQLLTLKHMGLLPEESIVQSQLMSRIQRVFTTARQWRYTGINRKDIYEDNLKAQRAKELFGEIPLAILNKEIQFAFLQPSRIKRHEKH